MYDFDFYDFELPNQLNCRNQQQIPVFKYNVSNQNLLYSIELDKCIV